MSSPEEPPTEPTATNGDTANEHGAPRPTGGQGAAEADAGRPGGGQPGTSGPTGGAGDQPSQPGQPGRTAQPGPSAQSEQPAAGGRPEPSDQSGEVQSGGEQQDAGQSGGEQQDAGQSGASDQPRAGQSGGEQQDAGQSGASDQPRAGQSGSGGTDGDEPEIPQLSPIPPGGTTAPVDTDRVFGRTGQPLTGAPTPAGHGAGWQRTTAPADAVAQPSEADLKKIRSLGRWALTLGIIGLLTLLFPGIGLALGIAAIVIGMRARRLARRGSVVSPGAVPGIVLGIVTTMITAVIVVTLAAFWTESRTYMTCLEGANTHSARAKCENEFKESLEKRGLVTERQ